jgi:secreted trypsin-like serine protease
MDYDPDEYPINVKIGCHTEECNKDGAETIIASKRIIHPGYNISGDEEDDFTLLVLASSVEDANLVKLNQDESYPTNDMISRAMGWGKLYANGPNPEVLQEVDLPLLSNAQCYLRNSVLAKKTVIGENKMCTFLPGKDSCQGDSGKMVLHLFMK